MRSGVASIAAQSVTTPGQAPGSKGKGPPGAPLPSWPAGRYSVLPVQPDGGLKCLGHPIGASGLRMEYEIYLQLHGRAGARQPARIDRGLTHNLGGHPHQNVCAVSIVGRHGA